MNRQNPPRGIEWTRIREVDDVTFILGLMRTNTDALGFIPSGTIRHRYVARGQYIIQRRHGKSVGYLLHGPIKPGKILTITQAVIEHDKRGIGYGMDMVNQLVDRARIHNARSIRLKCASDLPAALFWLAAGFEPTRVERPNNRRGREIITFILDLWPTLWTGYPTRARRILPDELALDRAGDEARR